MIDVGTVDSYSRVVGHRGAIGVFAHILYTGLCTVLSSFVVAFLMFFCGEWMYGCVESLVGLFLALLFVDKVRINFW